MVKKSDEVNKGKTDKLWLTKSAFSKRLRDFLIDRGWNQSEMARNASKFLDEPMCRSTVSVYLRGRSLPRPIHLHALSRALGVKPVDLLPEAPVSVAGAMADDVTVPFEMKSIGDSPDEVFLRVNQKVSFDAAVKIMAILKGEHGGDGR